MCRTLSIISIASLALFLASRATAQEQQPTDPAAMEAFQKMVDAYRSRPGLRVTASISIQVEQGGATADGQQASCELLMTESGRGVLKLNGYTCYLGSGDIIATHESTDHSYYTQPDQGSVLYTLMTLFMDMPFPHLALAYGDEDMDFLCMEFHQKAPNVRPSAVRTFKQGDREMIEIEMRSADEKMLVLVDPDSQLIESIDLEITSGYMVQAGSSLLYQHDFEYEELDAPPDGAMLTFQRGDRQRVDMLTSLIDRPPMPEQPDILPFEEAPPVVELAGKPAPDFVLETMGGDVIDLADLEGQVVVLDFWATWCGPCRRALPQLHDVADWVREEQLPVRVLTINVWEIPAGAENTPDARLKAAEDFWEKEGFSLPVLMDYSDHTAASYAIAGIPTTVVIRSDGVVHDVDSGAGEGYAENLRQRVLDAIRAVADERGGEGD